MIKMNAEDLVDALSASFERGSVKGRELAEIKTREAANLLTDENAQLRAKLSRAETQAMVAAQTAEFPTKYAEQKRIVKGIRDYFANIAKTKKKPTAEMLIFGLALGDIS